MFLVVYIYFFDVELVIRKYVISHQKRVLLSTTAESD